MPSAGRGVSARKEERSVVRKEKCALRKKASDLGQKGSLIICHSQRRRKSKGLAMAKTHTSGQKSNGHRSHVRGFQANQRAPDVDAEQDLPVLAVKV